MKEKMLAAAFGFIFFSVFPVEAAAAKDKPNIIMMSCYNQMGWSSRADVLYLDDEGKIWTYSAEKGIPSGKEKQLAFLRENAKDAELQGEVDGERLFELESLIAAAEPAEVKLELSGWDDFGKIEYSAVRYDTGNQPEIITLAVTGDFLYENMEENAHALYLAYYTDLLKLDPSVDIWYFPPTPYEQKGLAEFCQLPKSIFEEADVRCIYNDCEAGASEIAMSSTEEADILKWLSELTVVGKQNALSVSGGTKSYILYSKEGEEMGCFSFHNTEAGTLLVKDTGMYLVRTAEDKGDHL